MVIDAGSLDLRIAIQRRDSDRGLTGEQSNEWHTVATVWAAVTPLTAKEMEMSNRFTSKVDGKITIRFNRQFASTQAVSGCRAVDVVDRRVFDLHGVINRQREGALDIFVSEVPMAR
ncbi:MAG: phage head closure protein [Magnetococcus sp. YQC-5]